MTDSHPDPAPADEPHDTLAAEEFAIPAPDPGVPRDPDPRPHDILAAEEFAMPSPDARPAPGARGGSLPWAAALAGAALAGLLVLRGRAGRRRRR